MNRRGFLGRLAIAVAAPGVLAQVTTEAAPIAPEAAPEPRRSRREPPMLEWRLPREFTLDHLQDCVDKAAATWPTLVITAVEFGSNECRARYFDLLKQDPRVSEAKAGIQYGQPIPQNPYYQKNHVSAPGTVRSWFRKMRAADFERALPKWLLVTASDDPHDASKDHYGTFRRQGWTLFDTMKLVDRETAKTYPAPDLGILYFVQGGRVVGAITNIDWSGTPAALMGVEPTYREDYLGIDRSMHPRFSSMVQPAKPRGITLQDLGAFVLDAERRRNGRP